MGAKRLDQSHAAAHRYSRPHIWVFGSQTQDPSHCTTYWKREGRPLSRKSLLEGQGSLGGRGMVRAPRAILDSQDLESPCPSPQSAPVSAAFPAHSPSPCPKEVFSGAEKGSLPSPSAFLAGIYFPPLRWHTKEATKQRGRVRCCRKASRIYLSALQRPPGSQPGLFSLPGFPGPSETIFTSRLSPGWMAQLSGQSLPNLNNPSLFRGAF